MTKEQIKRFWTDRAKTTDVPRTESQVNFESDSQRATLRVETEIAVINKELRLSENDVVVDLGAGNGRFSLLFAPKVKKVTAVEYISDFVTAIEKQAKDLGFDNIETVNSPAEDFYRENYADVVFVSGLLNYLDSEQYRKITENIQKTAKHGSIVFLREPISILDYEFVVDKFSEELRTHYCSIYRTSKQHIEAFEKKGFLLEKFAPFFEDGNILNKRAETRQYYFVFRKGT